MDMEPLGKGRANTRGMDAGYLKLMMTPACPRLLDMINDFVVLRF